MLLLIILIATLIVNTRSEPQWFNPYDFELDGFEVNRGYFKSLDNKQDCQDINDGKCIYSNFINSPNILHVPIESGSQLFASSFHLFPDEAIVIAGFAPPKAEYFTITPYAHSINDYEIHSSISNNSLYLNSEFFVAIISGDLLMMRLVKEWFKNANTSLTTSIYNNYIYQLRIVQENDELNINQNTKYSVIIRHETIKSNEKDLNLLYSAAPSLLSWHVKSLFFNESKSQIISQLNQIKQIPATNEWDLLQLHTQNIKNIENKGKCDKIQNINQEKFQLANYNSTHCLSLLINCNFDQPESVIFESPPFENKNKNHNKNVKIFISGINHINTNNAIYSTINIINALDGSVVSQIKLNDLSNNENNYFVVFAEACDDLDKYENYMHCQQVDEQLLYGQQLQIVEILSNKVGINYEYIQPPNVAIMVKKYKNSYNRYSNTYNTDTKHQKNDKQQHKNKANIIFIMLDDLGWRDAGYNNAEYVTPNIDELASSGIILNNYYVHPVCTPTRTALYTGRYAFRYNLTIPLDIGQRRYLPMDELILPELLSVNGYDTHLIGKWHAGNPYWRNFPFNRGFDTFYGYSGGYIHYYDHTQCWQTWNGTPYPHISGENNLRLLSTLFPEGLCVYDFFDQNELEFNENYFTNLLSDRAMELISAKNSKSAPFFMLISLGTPHTPIVEPPQLFSECDASLQRYGVDRYNYCNMILLADQEIGRIVNALKQNNLWHDSVLIVSTDNGGIANVEPDNIIYGSFSSNVPLRGNKGTPFEGGNRGLAFVNGGFIDEYNLNGVINNKLYFVADWYETIINGIAGIDIDFSANSLDSYNIWESLIDENEVSPRNEWSWTVNFGGSPTALRQNNWKLVQGAVLLRDGYWDVNNMTLAPGQNISDTLYLFNISSDEIEYFNLKDDYPQIVEHLQERLLEIQNQGFTPSNDIFEIEGFVIAMLSGTSLPYLELTQEITIDF